MENKKKLPLPLLILIIGIGIGLVVAGVGLFKQFDAKRVNKEREDIALKSSQEAIDAANARLAEIADEYVTLKTQYETKLQECDSIDANMTAPNWYTNSTKCQREASDLHSKITDLEMEDTEIRNKDYTGYYQEVKPMSYQIFYIIGGIIAGLALLGAFIIYLVKGKKSY